MLRELAQLGHSIAQARASGSVSSGRAGLGPIVRLLDDMRAGGSDETGWDTLTRDDPRRSLAGYVRRSMVAPEHEPDGTDARPPTRADAAARRERILGAAAALAGDRRVSMIEIAAAAGVGRSTLYRHFPTRDALDRALTERPERAIASRDPPESRVATMPFRAPGQLGRERPLALEVTRVLDEVPPHLVPDQLVAEAPTTSRPRHRRRTTGVPRHQPAAPPRRAAHPHH